MLDVVRSGSSLNSFAWSQAAADSGTEEGAAFVQKANRKLWKILSDALSFYSVGACDRDCFTCLVLSHQRFVDSFPRSRCCTTKRSCCTRTHRRLPSDKLS